MALVSENTVLIEIITQAQMAGINQAKAGFMGFNPAVIGLTASAAGLGFVLKSVLDNTEAQERASRNLAQAYGYLKEKVPTKEIQDFIDKNASFIPSIFEAENGFASLARAGFNNTTQLRLMNDALDLSVASGMDLSQAVDTLTKGSLGLGRALTPLGISQKDINEALGKGATEADKFQLLLALLEPKIKKAREDQSDLAQASHRLNDEWEHLTSTSPLLGQAITTLVLNPITNLLKFLSTDKSVDQFFGNMQNDIVIAGGYVEALINQYDQLLGRMGAAGQHPQGYQFNKTPTGNTSPVNVRGDATGKLTKQ